MEIYEVFLWALAIVGIGAIVLLLMEGIYRFSILIAKRRANSRRFKLMWTQALENTNGEFAISGYSYWSDYDMKVYHLLLLDKRRGRIIDAGDYYKGDIIKFVTSKEED